MRKPVRKLITLVLAAVLILTAAGAAIAAPAEPETAPAEGGMETALVAVKQLIHIDESVYTEFSYGSTYSNQQTREGLIWSFNWSDTKNSSIYAYVTDDGTLLQFRKYEYGKSNFGFAEISRDKAAGLALEFLKKASPDIYPYYSQKGAPEITITDGEYRFSYTAKINGHEFSAASASVGINKFTGAVTEYNTSNLSPENYTFEGASKLIGNAAAITAYADKLGLSLEYRSYYDYSSGKLKIFPVYRTNASGSDYISAVTGEVVAYVYDSGLGTDGDKNAGSPTVSESASADSGVGGRLTPQEIAAIEKAKGFISSDDALAKLLAVMELSDIDTAAFSESHINLNNDYINRDRYIYSVNMYTSDPGATDGIYHIYGRVDAETGRVLSFSYYYNAETVDESKLITEGQAKAVADKFLAANAPDELKKIKLDSVVTPFDEKYYSNQSYQFSYYREENGVPFRDNGVSITLDARTGKVTNYSLDWYLNATFPSVANVLTAQKALTNYVAQNGLNTNYITVGGGKVSLVYDFGISGYLDPFTGKALGYNGQTQETSTAAPDYSDVKGHWSESYVNRLLENGVYQWNGKFEPERVMTQLEFLQYLMELEPWYQAEPLRYFTDNGINASGIKADANTPVTRQEAARIIAEYMGYGKLAEKHKWFAYPFTGAVDEAYKGYITVCCALGIISGTGGEYNAKANVTRAEAATMLHNLILAKTDA